jgi:hypothetical protein
MRAADATLLVVPGFGGGSADHWYSRWQPKLSTATRIDLPDFSDPTRATWVAAIVRAAEAAPRPVVLIAHSLGVIASVHAAPLLAGKVRGAFLVAPSDWNRADLLPGVMHDFAPVPREPLPFPSLVVASRTDPYCAFEVADDFAAAWGAVLIDAGDAGHINAASGHGPWPEGLMRLAGFLKRLG